MNIAFYAPLKPPDSPVPSGDRLIARMLWTALEAGGHRVTLVSRLRSFDKTGNRERQQRIARIGAWSAERLIRHWQARKECPDVWLTYHLYHKAPDWLGPVVTRELGIPYCIAEASSSPRQAHGPWTDGHRAAANALGAANLVVSLNPKDEPGIRPLIGPHTRLASLQPFIDGAPFHAARLERAHYRAALAQAFGLDANVPWLLAVGMLRAGDKAASYALLSEALARLGQRSWQLIVVGDGTARAEIATRYRSFGNRVRFVGQQDAEAIARLMASADIFVWPAINEAIGMVFIEAAMAGLAVVGANRPGVAAVVTHGTTGLLVPEHDAHAFAAAITRLLDDEKLRAAMGDAAAVRAAAQNSLDTAGQMFRRRVEALVR